MSGDEVLRNCGVYRRIIPLCFGMVILCDASELVDCLVRSAVLWVGFRNVGN